MSKEAGRMVLIKQGLYVFDSKGRTDEEVRTDWEKNHVERVDHKDFRRSDVGGGKRK
jgi:hypothetical protein